MFITIPRMWINSTAVCIASGPSLLDSELELCKDKGFRFIAVNDNYKRAPWAEILYAADSKWWKENKGIKDFNGVKISIEKKSEQYGNIKTLKNLGHSGLSRNRTGLMTGHNSGYQAINLAYLLGAKRILLLGYDMKDGKDGRNHWFGEHKWKSDNFKIPYNLFLREFPSIAKELKKEGVEVLNLNMNSKLECFKKVRLENIV